MGCCTQGAGFGSASGGPTVVARARCGPPAHPGGAWTAADRIRGGVREDAIRASGEFRHVNRPWHNPGPAWAGQEMAVNSSDYKTAAGHVSNRNFGVNSQMADHTI